MKNEEEEKDKKGNINKKYIERYRKIKTTDNTEIRIKIRTTDNRDKNKDEHHLDSPPPAVVTGTR